MATNYSDEDIADILKRAAELQAQEDNKASLRPGLTQQELEAVAADAGLDPRHVQQAIRERQGRTRSIASADKNATHIFAERHADIPFTEEAWEDIVMYLRNRFDTGMGVGMGDGMNQGLGMATYGRGVVEQIGKSREWRHMAMSGIETRLTIRPREDNTDIRLSQRVGMAAPTTEGILYALAAASLVGPLAGAFGDSAALGFTVFFIVWVLLSPIIRYLDIRWREKKHRELNVLADEVHHFVDLHAATTTEPGTTDVSADHPTEGTISLDEQQAPDLQDTTSRDRSRTR